MARDDGLGDAEYRNALLRKAKLAYRRYVYHIVKGNADKAAVALREHDEAMRQRNVLTKFLADQDAEYPE